MKQSTAATIDASALRTSLSPLVPIFDAFNHRHKNQHGSSHWWSHFGILRRSVKALLSCPARQDVLLPRVRWLKYRIVPRVYEPFTQLAADNQYAPLGLLLIGLLARINTIVKEALPAEDTVTPTAILEAKTRPPTETATDKGTVISRGDLTQRKVPKDSRPDDSRTEVPPVEDDNPTIPAKKKKKKAVEEREQEAPLKKKKKKSKTKGGDDFSSMFGSI